LLASKLVGNRGKVFAFEPESYNFSLLQENTKNNKLTNAILSQSAVASKSGKLKLFLSKTNPGDHQIYDSGEKRDFVEIDTVSLDDYFMGCEEKIDLVKMDVEGSEFGVLKGMTVLFSHNPNLKLITEFWPYGLDKAGTRAKDFLAAIVSRDYVLYELDEEQKKVRLTSAAELLSAYTPDNKKYTNLFCERKNNGA
jgi:FkbM family methyltransferase